MEGVLSEGVLSGRSLCLDGVMYGGGFVRGGFVRRGFCPTFQMDRRANTQAMFFIGVARTMVVNGESILSNGLGPMRVPALYMGIL